MIYRSKQRHNAQELTKDVADDIVMHSGTHRIGVVYNFKCDRIELYATFSTVSDAVDAAKRIANRKYNDVRVVLLQTEGLGNYTLIKPILTGDAEMDRWWYDTNWRLTGDAERVKSKTR